MGRSLTTFGQVIQWAANAQIELLEAYTLQWGFACKADIWENYSRMVNAELPLLVDRAIIDAKTIVQLSAFLTDPQQKYHLEMSTDEMALLFLDFLEKH